AFYLLAPFAAATDPITGAKLGAAVYGALLAVPMYGVAARLGGGRGAGLVAAVFATTSVGSAYLTIEFVKNGIGLTVALAALWLVLAAADRPSRRRIAAALAGLIAAWATHKMAAALVAVIAIPAVLAAGTAHGRLRGRRLIYATGGVVLAGAAALALGAVFPRRFLALEDAGLVRGLFSAAPRWSAPALVFPGGQLAVGCDALLGLGFALAAAAALVVVRRRRRLVRPGELPPATALAAPSAASAIAAWPILGIAFAIGLPFLAVGDAQGLGFRLRIAAFVPAALAAAVLIRAAPAALLALASPSSAVERAVRAGHRHRDLALAGLAAALALVRQPGDRLDGEIVTHPALVSAALALRGRVPPGVTLIVPERHIAFLVAWYTGAPIAIRPGGVPPDRRYRLLPLHFIRADWPLDRALIAARAEPSLIPPLGVHPGHPNGLVLVAESTWTWVLDHLPAADRARYAAWPTI
ncbi:MAG TPA: hypothetical protein VK607_02175, partial [Kofleriaceae bacterium]|nr:hypothetical protein [Kofleriaceae bacterium]